MQHNQPNPFDKLCTDVNKSILKYLDLKSLLTLRKVNQALSFFPYSPIGDHKRELDDQDLLTLLKQVSQNKLNHLVNKMIYNRHLSKLDDRIARMILTHEELFDHISFLNYKELCCLQSTKSQVVDSFIAKLEKKFPKRMITVMPDRDAKHSHPYQKGHTSKTKIDKAKECIGFAKKMIKEKHFVISCSLSKPIEWINIISEELKNPSSTKKRRFNKV